MSVVKINVLTVPAEQAATLESRFAAGAGAVEGAEGFEHFELLRPVDGTDRYLVYTRWRSEADFEAWQSGQAFARGHAPAASEGGTEAPPRPAATGAELWSFDVVQQVGAPTGSPTESSSE